MRCNSAGAIIIFCHNASGYALISRPSLSADYECYAIVHSLDTDDYTFNDIDDLYDALYIMVIENYLTKPKFQQKVTLHN